MIEVGQIFQRKGYSLCVLDILDYNQKKYALFSVEREKVEYKFYEIMFDNAGYHLEQITDTEVENALFSIVDNKEV